MILGKHTDNIRLLKAEAMAEAKLLRLQQNKPVKASSSVRAMVTDMDVKNVFTDEKRFQNRKNAFSEDSKDRIINAVYNGTFDWAKFDAVIVWRDPKKMRFFVLSGHSRLEAFKELSKMRDYAEFAEIPVKIFKGTENDAINLALTSNTLSTKETDTERATYWANRRARCEINGGLGATTDCERLIENEVREAEGKNANFILNLSFLNPDGYLFDSLHRLGAERDNDNTNVLRTISNWIGEARRKNKGISDIQETEIAKFLMNGGYGSKSHQFKNKTKFNERLQYSFDKWEHNGADPSKPLNLANTLSKSSFEKEFDIRLENAKLELAEATALHEEKYNKFLQALIDNEISQERMDQLMQPLVLAVRTASQKVKQTLEQKGEVQKASRAQTSLFGMLYGLECGEEETEFESFLGDLGRIKNSEIYDQLTERIIKMVEDKPLFWRKGWVTQGAAYNFVSKTRYSGINNLMLNFIAPSIFEDNGIENISPVWMTYKQAKEAGGQVMKGSKSMPVHFFNFMYFKIVNGKQERISQEQYRNLLQSGSKNIKLIPFLKKYNVFNAIQIEGIDFGDVLSPKNTNQQIVAGEFIVDAYADKPKIGISVDGRAFYRPLTDEVKVPKLSDFKQEQEYYGTLFHELAHSTGHKKRLNRNLGDSFGTAGYSFEELIAEFTALYLSADAGMAYFTMNNSAAYIQGWNKKLIALMKEDNKLIFKAAAEAQKARDYIMHGKSLDDFDGNVYQPKTKIKGNSGKPKANISVRLRIAEAEAKIKLKQL